ncbi:unnamed protein product, partial [Staurois parvus]
MYTDHQGTDDQCALMISVAPAVPAVSVHQCHINATYQCPSELPFSVTHQCHLSVPPISASQCCLSVPCINDACQRISVLPISAPISAHQCHLSV